jgi:hypothetical protein
MTGSAARLCMLGWRNKRRCDARAHLAEASEFEAITLKSLSESTQSKQHQRCQQHTVATATAAVAAAAAAAGVGVAGATASSVAAPVPTVGTPASATVAAATACASSVQSGQPQYSKHHLLPCPLLQLPWARHCRSANKEGREHLPGCEQRTWLVGVAGVAAIAALEVVRAAPAHSSLNQLQCVGFSCCSLYVHR